MKYGSQIHDDRIFFYPNIPPDKLKNAVSAYAPVPNGERILALIDDTILRSGKSGVLLTNKSISACNALESPRSFALRSISSVKCNDGWINNSCDS
jgi:hypothetical protein